MCHTRSLGLRRALSMRLIWRTSKGFKRGRPRLLTRSLAQWLKQTLVNLPLCEGEQSVAGTDLGD